MIRLEHGGTGERCYLMLHGLGATGAVWRDTCAEIDRARLGRWIAVDLPGHGGSAPLERYSVGAMAGTIAAALEPTAAPIIIGHSLGVYVGLALASEWFGIRVAALLGFGPKIRWTEAELAATVELAARPARTFTDETEAWGRYRRVSGLVESVAPDTATLARGVVAVDCGFRPANDPRSAQVTGAPFDTLARSARCPLLLARGERDPMVTLADLREYDPHAVDIVGAGHNVHVERPAIVVQLARWAADRAA
jgi:pimeloyl-ACP methyl ester carboxylesterase